MIVQALTVEEDRRLRKNALYERVHGAAPDCYIAQAEWWEIYAEETKNPNECFSYASNLRTLADDMKTRPMHYTNKPLQKTDYEWSKSY